MAEREETEAVHEDIHLATSASSVTGQVIGRRIVQKEGRREADPGIGISTEEKVDASSARRKDIKPEIAKKMQQIAEEAAVEEEDILGQAATAQETDTAAEEIGAIRKDEEIEAIHQEIEEIGVTHHPGTEEIEAIHVIKIEREVEIEEEEVDPDLDLIVQDTSNHHMIVEIAITNKIKEKVERNLLIEMLESMIILSLNLKRKK